MARKKKGYRIPLDQRNAGLKQIKSRIKELQLKTTGPQIQITASNDGDGTTSSRESTLKRYESIWKGLLDYCIVTGDYTSAIILDRHQCPLNPFPVSSDTAINYLRMRYLKKDKALKCHKTGQIVVDKFGQPIQTKGDWRGSSSIGLYRSALSVLHSHYESTRGAYFDECADCREIGLERARKGETCPRHIGDSRYHRKGCVTQDDAFVKKIKMAHTYVETHYEARRSFAFTPKNVREAREFFLGQNTIWALMMWTIMILGISLFLRVDEVLEMTVEQFDENFFIIPEPGVIKGLCVKVSGKCDQNKWIHFQLWWDDVCPELCPVRAVLLWLRISGIKSGKLFPFIEQSGRTVDSSRGYPYQRFLNTIADLCMNRLCRNNKNRVKNRIFGTHMLRKTAFLMATWSYFETFGRNIESIVLSNIRNSSRHASEKHLDVYLDDCWSLKELADRADPGNPDNKVGHWRPIHISNLDAHESLNETSRAHLRPVVEVATDFVEKSLKVHPGSTASISEIHRKAFAAVQGLTCREQLEKALDDVCQGDKAKHAIILALIDREKSQVINNLRAVEAATSSHNQSGNKRQRSQEQEESDQGAADIPMHDGQIVLSKDFQKDIGRHATTPAMRVALAMELLCEVETQLSENKTFGPNTKLKRYVYRAGKTVACVRQCFDGDIDAFLVAHGTWSISAFAERKVCAKCVSHVFSVE